MKNVDSIGDKRHDQAPRRDNGRDREAYQRHPDPKGWRLSKRGDPFLTRAGLTVVIYRRADGFAWRIAAWGGGNSIEAPEPLLTVERAKAEAIKALPEARRQLQEERERRRGRP
jgi:hypothetical protein